MMEESAKQNLMVQKSVHDISAVAFSKYHENVFEIFPFYPMHWHEDMEIVRVKSGDALFYVDGTKHKVTKGDVVVLRSFALHSITESHNLEVEAIVFNVRLLTDNDGRSLQYFAPLLHGNAVPVKITEDDDYHDFFQKCLTDIFDNDLQEQDAFVCLNQLFSQICSVRLTNTSPNFVEDKRCYTVRRALECIYSDFSAEITVEKLAKLCGYSDFYTMKLFKQFTGYSCVDYANAYRLTVAGRKLKCGDGGIAAIAKSVGFNNISYFNRQFKKLYGTTPKEFRKTV